ncbi:MAG: restriction endonuclease [Verrucomicrobiales bacterium]|nr:restriction endonuclease [Verrucomicrobiales bacterium]
MGWKTVELSSLLRSPLRNGHSAKTSDNPNGVRILTLTAVTTGDFSERNTKRTTADPNRVSNLWLEPGDILIERSNTPELVGTTRLYLGPRNFAIYPDLVIRAQLVDQIVPRFVELVLQSRDLRLYFQRRAKGMSGSMPKIDQETISEALIPVAPLNEQKRIVAKIEELFSELDAGEESLRKARRQLGVYRQSLLRQAFEGKLTVIWREQNPDLLQTAKQVLTHIESKRQMRYQQQLNKWELNGKIGTKPSKPKPSHEQKELGPNSRENLPPIPKDWNWLRLDQIAVIGTGMSVSRERRYVDPVEVPYLRVANVQRGHLDLTQLKKMLVESDRLDDLRLKAGDILFNEGGDRDQLGRGWVWGGAPDPCITQNHVFRATLLSRQIIPEFVSHWGNGFGQEFFHLSGKQTTNLASINKAALSNLPVPVPPYEEQQEILRLLDEQFTVIEQNEREIDTALKRSEALRQSILKKAFSGQLVAQDPADEPASVLLERIRKEREGTLVWRKNSSGSSQSTGLDKHPPRPAPEIMEDFFPEITAAKPSKAKPASTPSKTDLQAGLVALAIVAHEDGSEHLGHVKAEKIVHLCDVIAQLQLDRHPVKDAAGPNDFPQAMKVEHRAKMQGWFTVRKKPGAKSYTYQRGQNFDRLLHDTEVRLGSQLQTLRDLIGDFALMSVKEAELVATVHAAWNNLILAGESQPTQEAIVNEARENWHPDKLKIPRQQFFDAIAWIEGANVIPTGIGQPVDMKKQSANPT